MTVGKSTQNWRDAQRPLQEWYSTSLGETILNEMNVLLEGLLPDIFGYQGIQIGQLSDQSSLLDSSGLYKKLIMGADTGFGDADIVGDALELPVTSETMNLVVLPHTLDFCSDPHQVLREADRVLTRDGHLVIIGFNRYSLMGLRRLMMGWRGAVPWSGDFYSRGRICDWLSLLSFRQLQEESFFLRLPFSSAPLLNKTRFIERSRPMLGKLGGVYIIHARKQTMPMTLARHKWARRNATIAVGSLVQRTNQRSSRRERTPE